MGLNKEEIYDEKISPLMKEIIGLCKAHGIAMIASFALPTEEDTGLCCTTCLPDENGKNAPGHRKAFGLLRNETSPLIVRTTQGDKTLSVTAIL